MQRVYGNVLQNVISSILENALVDDVSLFCLFFETEFHSIAKAAPEPLAILLVESGC